MNRFFIIIIIALFISCSNIENSITVSAINSKKQVMLKLHNKRKVLIIPFNIVVKNSSLKKVRVGKIFYERQKKTGGNSVRTYKENDTKDYSYLNDYISLFTGSKTYTITPYYWFGYLEIKDSLLLREMEKLKPNQRDTIELGTLQEFSSKHPDFTKYLLEGDSIRVFLDKGGPAGGMAKTIPVEW